MLVCAGTKSSTSDADCSKVCRVAEWKSIVGSLWEFMSLGVLVDLIGFAQAT